MVEAFRALLETRRNERTDEFTAEPLKLAPIAAVAGRPPADP